VSMGTQKTDLGPGSVSKVAPMRVRASHMPQQPQAFALFLQVQWQLRDKRQAVVVDRNQTGKRVRKHQFPGDGGVSGCELGWQIHGDIMPASARRTKPETLSSDLQVGVSA